MGSLLAERLAATLVKCKRWAGSSTRVERLLPDARRGDAPVKNVIRAAKAPQVHGLRVPGRRQLGLHVHGRRGHDVFGTRVRGRER